MLFAVNSLVAQFKPCIDKNNYKSVHLPEQSTMISFYNEHWTFGRNNPKRSLIFQNSENCPEPEISEKYFFRDMTTKISTMTTAKRKVKVPFHSAKKLD